MSIGNFHNEKNFFSILSDLDGFGGKNECTADTDIDDEFTNLGAEISNDRQNKKRNGR